MIETPPHIVDAGIARAELPFAWDEWATKSYYWDVSQALFDRLNAFTDEANMALTVALGEWVYHRFDAVSTDSGAVPSSGGKKSRQIDRLLNADGRSVRRAQLGRVAGLARSASAIIAEDRGQHLERPREERPEVDLVPQFPQWG